MHPATYFEDITINSGKVTHNNSNNDKIELNIKDLSLSLVPQSPAWLRILKRIVGRRDNCGSTGGKRHSNIGGADAEGDKKSDNRIIPEVGINILRHVSLKVAPGQVCLIMGGSGSGKTTLLNAIAGRMDPCQTAISGQILFNNEQTKSVRETLRFAADLRLPSSVSHEKKEQLIESLILELGLKNCAETIIGDASGAEVDQGGLYRGISGGERRRVSAALSLVTNPHMLLCDEVTSGLDAFSSFELVKTLTAFAQSSHNSVILSIHQPRSEVFKFLCESDGQFLLLSKGDVVYSGPLTGLLPWFDSVGIPPCPNNMNPFDYVMDVCMRDFSSASRESESSAQRDHLVQAWRNKMGMYIAGENSLKERKRETKPRTPIGTDGAVLLGTLYPEERAEEQRQERKKKKQQEYLTCKSKVDDSGLRDVDWARSHQSFRRQTMTLIRRAWINKCRDRQMFWGILVVDAILGILLGSLFYNLGDSLDDIRSRSSICSILVTFQPYIFMIVVIYKTTSEIKTFERERRDRWYGPWPFLISTAVSSVPENIINSAAHSLIVYYMAGIRTGSIEYVGWYTLINIAFHFTVSTFATFCTVVFTDFDTANALASTIYLAFSLTSGFFVVTSNIPHYVSWIKYISYVRLGYQSLLSLEFTDNHLNCPFVGQGIGTTSSNATSTNWDPTLCAPWDGNNILRGQLEATPNYFHTPVAYLLIQYAVYILLSWVVLTCRSTGPAKVVVERSSAQRTIRAFWKFLRCQEPTEPASGNPIDNEENREDFAGNGDQEGRKDSRTVTRVEMFSQGLSPKEPVTIQIKQLSLSVQTKSWEWTQLCPFIAVPTRKIMKKQLLQDIDFVIPPGQLTAILGGSGCGKTSLLNALLRRTSAEFSLTGDIYVNGTMNPTAQKLNTVCSYVRQEDNFLMSHLTVRETFVYVARLCLPDTLSKQEKLAKVDEIIDLMGLRDCADVLIGDDETSGISGGQRRRVSIGMQLILEPSVLVLDEPSSGLDSVTALAIVQTLKRIAACGRTVICTIHQPRNDIWNEFDNVMLLLTGGRLAYSGKASQVVDYFANAGHVIPKFANPPDFIIDTVSINTRSPTLEESTRATVDALAALYVRSKRHISSSEDRSDTSSSVIEMLPALGDHVPHYSGFLKATPILIHRSFVNAARQKGQLLIRIVQPIVLAIVSLLFLGRLDDSPWGVLNRLGIFQQITTLSIGTMMYNIEYFPKERGIALREIANGNYGPSTFLASYMAMELPSAAISSFCVAAFIHLFVNLQHTLLSYLTLVWAFTFMTGFMVTTLPPFLKHINYLSVFKYSSIVSALNEFKGLQFKCTEKMVQNGECPMRTGEEVLMFLNFENENLWMNIGLIILMIVLYRLLAWYVLVSRVRSSRR
ncbi:hypothetical protein BG011_007672 [Mortierella polycephala]|uniref:ABC transporter domain-containing protein n=1 Tax=Mortierella polycephala TaxID=41804 RepID=A0A9P6QF52_9FUNG|nr:hypothetical protein BG011_007672 [Mortierella polycephala]